MTAPALAPFTVRYRRDDAQRLLDDPGTLALIGFGAEAATSADPRALRVPLTPLQVAVPHEQWVVDAAVSYGRDGAVRWASGGGWLYAAIELDESAHGGAEAAAEHAYRQLGAFTAARPERHVQRIWNYLGAINAGEGDAEHYRRFCSGRARGMAPYFEAYPAATAIGHGGAAGLLQVYWLAASAPGVAVENPRQTSAWRYPRQYGPTAPTFARAERLPGEAGLAISGTAAVVGHATLHAGDVLAQLEESLANLDALQAAAGLAPGFGAASSLKVYIREPRDARAIAARLDARLAPEVPRLLLQGDICRRDLLIEIDGWRFV